MGFYARFVPTKGALKAYFDTVYSAINAIFGSTGTTDGTVPRADGTGGKTLQSSGVVIDDNNDVTGVRNLAATGSVSGGIPRVVKAATGSLSAADMRGCLVTNKGQAADAVVSLPAVFEGAHCLVCLETTVAKYWRLDPDASEVIIFDGTTLTGGYYVGIASAVDGAMLSVVARYAETTLVWDIQTLVGTWAAQA